MAVQWQMMAVNKGSRVLSAQHRGDLGCEFPHGHNDETWSCLTSASTERARGACNGCTLTQCIDRQLQLDTALAPQARKRSRLHRQQQRIDDVFATSRPRGDMPERGGRIGTEDCHDHGGGANAARAAVPIGESDGQSSFPAGKLFWWTMMDTCHYDLFRASFA